MPSARPFEPHNEISSSLFPALVDAAVPGSTHHCGTPRAATHALPSAARGPAVGHHGGQHFAELPGRCAGGAGLSGRAWAAHAGSCASPCSILALGLLTTLAALLCTTPPSHHIILSLCPRSPRLAGMAPPARAGCRRQGGPAAQHAHGAPGGSRLQAFPSLGACSAPADIPGAGSQVGGQAAVQELLRAAAWTWSVLSLSERSIPTHLLCAHLLPCPACCAPPRLLPHLQVLTDRPIWLHMPDSRTSQEDWISLQAVMGSCATACSCLLFMLTYQIPRPGVQEQGQVVQEGLGLLRACQRASVAKVLSHRTARSSSQPAIQLAVPPWWMGGNQALELRVPALRCSAAMTHLPLCY